jgi:hypothetical protein
VADEQLKQAPLGRGEVDFHAVGADDFLGGEVDGEVARVEVTPPSTGGAAARRTAARSRASAPLRLRRGAALPENDSTPFGAASAAREAGSASKALLLAMSKHLEREAAAIGESCLVLSIFQTAADFALASRRYAALADGNAYVAEPPEGS